MLIEIFPDESERFSIPFILENSRGLEPVPTQNTEIRGRADRFVKKAGLPISHVGGARDVKGNNKTETYLPHPDTGRLGSARPDISFKCKGTGRRLYINTIDTKADGIRPSTKEQASAVRIILNSKSGDILLLIPKPPKGQDIDYDAVEKIMGPLLREICEPEPEIDPRSHTAPEDLIRDMFKGQ
jgi:hypothetical protein